MLIAIMMQYTLANFFGMAEIRYSNFFNDTPLMVIAGPCQIESRDHAMMIAEHIANACDQLKVPFVFKAESIIALLICAEGINISKVNGIAFPVPFNLIGGYKSFFKLISAPNLERCSVTLFIGRLLKELSPINLTLILFDEIKPATSLIPVPELPKSIDLFG